MKTRNVWQFWRPVYRYSWAILQRSSYRDFTSLLRSQDKKLKILDIGTGTGEYIKHLRTNHEYVFTDLDEKSLKEAEVKASKFLPQDSYKLVNGDAFKVLDQSDKADIISILHVISVVPDPQDLILKSIQQLNEGGTLVVYISRFSKKFSKLCDPLIRPLGFKTVDLSEMGLNWQIRDVGLLNECYVYTKTSNA